MDDRVKKFYQNQNRFWRSFAQIWKQSAITLNVDWRWFGYRLNPNKNTFEFSITVFRLEIGMFLGPSLLDEGYCPYHTRVLLGESMYCPDCNCDWLLRLSWWRKIWFNRRNEFESFDEYKGADYD